jgi:hypothetical protein
MSDPNSVVDFLRVRGRDSSQQARRDLWQLLSPFEPYQFTAEQNLRLLAWLRLGEQRPQIDLIRGTQVYDVGEELKVRLTASGPAQMHSGFRGAQPLHILPGQTVTVGSISGPGIHPVLVQQDDLVSESLFLAAPSADGRLDVAIWEQSTRHHPSPIPALPDDTKLLERFFDAVTVDVLESAAKSALDKFIQPENLFAVGFDVFIGITVVIVSTPAGVGFAFNTMAGIATESAFNFMEAIIKEANLPDGDKQRLRTMLQVGNIAQISLNLRKVARSKRVCEKLVGLTSAGNIAVTRFELQPSTDSTRVAGSLIRDSFNRSISLFCEIESAEAQRKKKLKP